MPPSPALRFSPSPGRELRAENHKRGRSLEGALLFREKDEDLALFNEMQTKERDTFLLQATDDFEDAFSTKLRHFSDYKLGISVPIRGESSNLLNVDGEKNDYDWLLTPPDTPLFPSLDDEPPPVNAVPRGRPRSQPISISRSSTMKSQRSSRGSASPNRLSPSPRSGTSALQSRGRTSSAPHSSPTPSQRQGTPSRRPSPSPSKSPTPVRRSSTPTPRRMSTGSSGVISSSGARGVSPVKTNRGNSSSPKIRAWQTNIPGFSSDAPPNLRTSLADRPATYVRGSSPASRNGKDSASKIGRQSMSPTPSRSSSHSHDRDRFSCQSKASMASSGDDDVDYAQSLPPSNSDHSSSKRAGSYPNNRALAFSKKPAKVLSPSSAPKRSFDSAPRQTDQRKTPPNMFRPLLSSVPSTTFYVGKGSSAHRSLISRNSSITTSSNASSDQGTSLALDNEGSEHNQYDMGSECEKAPYTDVQEEVFSLDQDDAVSENVGHVIGVGSLIQLVDFDVGPTIDHGLVNPAEVAHHSINKEIIASPAALHIKDDDSEVDNLEGSEICSNCGCRYYAIDSRENNYHLCPDCGREDKVFTVSIPETIEPVLDNPQAYPAKVSEQYEPSDELEQLVAVPETLQVSDMDEPMVSQHEVHVVTQGQDSFVEQILNHSHDGSLASLPVDEGDHRHDNQQETGQLIVSSKLPVSDAHSSVNVGVSEGTGISVLLKRSSSSKGAVLQGRTFTASTISYNDPSYARESSNSMRSSFGHGSVSTSSSADFSSNRQTETRLYRNLSGKKSDVESYRNNNKHTRSQSTGTSVSGISNSAHQSSSLATSTHEDVDSSDGTIKHDAFEASVASQELVVDSENTEIDICAPVTRTTVLVEDNNECTGSTRTADASTSEASSGAVGIQLEDKQVPSYLNNEELGSYSSRCISDEEVSVITPKSSFEEGYTVLKTSVDGEDVSEIPNCSSNVKSVIEIQDCDHSAAGFKIDDASPQSKNTNDVPDPSVATTSDKDSLSSVRESKTPDHAHVISEESTVRLEGRQGSNGRSLTLEEATDTILFCNSIVHDLAYQAASIAMEKENSVPLEDSRPAVTILGKSNSNRNNPRGRTVVKRALKSNKARQRQMETNPNPKHPLSSKAENDENLDESLTRNVGLPDKFDCTKPPPKLESKCNCAIM